MIRRYLFAILLAALMTGCGAARFVAESFSGPPAFTLDEQYREPVAGTNYTVSVNVAKGFEDGGFMGQCALPDAGNDIHCLFHLSSLETYPRTPDGYRFLSFETAREMCTDALWSVGLQRQPGANRFMSNPLVNACSRALMQHRWMEDAAIYEPEPGS